MEVVDQRLLVCKVVSADIDDWLSKGDRLNNSAVPWFGHDDIDGGQEGFKGEWKRRCGMDA